jgi:adenosine deaminase
MTPEFMLLASLLGLAQFGRELKGDVRKIMKERAQQVQVLGKFLVLLEAEEIVPAVKSRGILTIPSAKYEGLGAYVDHLKQQLAAALDAENPGELRAALHAASSTRIRDHLGAGEVKQAVKGLDNVHTLIFALGRSTIEGTEIDLSDDDIIRVWLLALAGNVTLTINGETLNVDVAMPDQMKDVLVRVHDLLSNSVYGLTCECFRARNWATGRSTPHIKCKFMTAAGKRRIIKKLATGRSSGNLKDYLEGCEFSGSCHLKHPYLIHRYAADVVKSFHEQGILYAELRASVDGYVSPSIGFGFKDACECMISAFSSAQAKAAKQESKQKKAGERKVPVPKVSLIFVGKRHKPMRELMLEADAVGMMYAAIPDPVANFEEETQQCRVVGFDLAGNEPEYPPALFADEFRRLSRHHIPLTVHAGENSPAQYIEDAIVVLGAGRIGHGLALVEDPGLLQRVREDGVCIELCPISNDQTGAFSDARPYPLHRFMQEGIDVCLNTDNPIISDTDIVKEFFQASWAVSEAKCAAQPERTDTQQGLSLWDALQLIKTGFKRSFLPLSVRRQLLAKADDLIYEKLLEPEVLERLRDLADE